MKEFFFHNIQEALSFLEKEYGSTWYNKVLVDLSKNSGRVEDGKAMVRLKIDSLGEAQKSIQFKLDEILNEETKEVENVQPRVEIEVSKDGMNAYATLFPSPSGEIPTKNDVMKAIREKGITRGINEEAILSAVKEKCTFKPFLFAQGRHPISSKNATFKLLFPTNGIRTKRESDGKVDYASMYEIVWCRKGEKLAEKIPAKRGEDGYDVFGKLLPAKEPEDFDLSKLVGDNTRIVEDSIVASCDGQPFFDGEKVNVREVFVVNGNVDYGVGNVDFIGSVLVRGDVKEDFKVKSGKDVVIDGVVEGGSVQAKGSIVVKGGIFGKQKGIIRCGQRFKAKFLSDVTIFSNGDVEVDEYIMNSRVISNGNVVVSGKGWIVGGSVKASKDVIVKVLGSVSKLPTHVSAGVDFEFSRKEEEIEKDTEILVKKLRNVSELLERFLGFLKKSTNEKERAMILSAIKKFQRQKIEIISEIQSLKKELANLETLRHMKRMRKNSKVVVKEKCFEGTRVTIFDETLSIHFDIGPTIFSFDKIEEKILATPYKKWR